MRPIRLLAGALLLAVAVTMQSPLRAGPSAPWVETHPPYVGLAVFGAGGTVSQICSGVLVSPEVFVTAGHCTDGTDVALVWFESDVTFDSSAAVTGVPMTHPAYRGIAGSASGSDVGVVLLEDPVDVSSYATLPAVGVLDGLFVPDDSGPAFTVVGYGLQAVVSFMQNGQVRYRGVPIQIDLFAASIFGDEFRLFSGRRPRQAGGACLTDTGGPAMIGMTDVVAGVGAFVSRADCAGAGSYSRLDTDRAQEFIRSFLQ